ncbi:MAG: hypothetical protein QM652_04770 [Legionella sp.]|uniref:hypothetical protein n=1 Tax=Legionella sp. TaxID=459 RepID=UPI0039E3B247
MQSKLENDWDAINDVLTPLINQREYYKQAITQIRDLLFNYFLNPTLINTLHEPIQSDEPAFYFENVRPAIERCLNLDEIHKKEQKIHAKSNHPYYAQALDHIVSECDLPFRSQDDRYNFTSKKIIHLMLKNTCVNLLML